MNVIKKQAHVRREKAKLRPPYSFDISDMLTVEARYLRSKILWQQRFNPLYLAI